MTAMTIERAVDNAIVSTEMEGFVITEKTQGAYYEAYEQGNCLIGSFERSE